MPGSAGRIVVVIVCNLILVAVFHFFGASSTTCWFTFLLLLVLGAVAEVDMHLYEVERKLDAVPTTR